MINKLLMSLNDQQIQLLYNLFNTLFWITLCIFLLLYIRKAHKISKVKSLIVLLIPYAVGQLVMLFAGLIEKILDPMVFLPAYFPVYIVPVVLSISAAISFFIKVDLADILDRVLLAVLAARPFTCLACLCYGCCHGAVAEWGIYSCVKQTDVIPLRAFEILVVLIFWATNHRMYKNDKFKHKGQCAAIGIIEFGAMIVVFDLLCTSPAKIFLSLSMVGITSVMTVVIGLIMKKKFSKPPKATEKANKKPKRKKRRK